MSFDRRYDNEFDQLVYELSRRLKKIFKGPGPWLLVLLLVAGVGAAFTSFYTVQPDEEAVVLRFGRYVKTTPPGLHFKWPLGIEKAIKVKTKLVLQEEFGFRTSDTHGKRTSYSNQNLDRESLMLTGDLNVADVEWTTQFQISDAQKFLFNIRNPIVNIRDISQAVMRRVVGDRLVNDVLTVGRIEIANEAVILMQKIIDQYDMGVRIISVKLQDVNPPDAVKPSFNEVNAAKQEQEEAINRAEKEYNRVIPEARGKADQEIANAEGYAAALINRSKGDADRFKQVLTEYKKAPAITRKRLYIETMEKVFKQMESMTVVDKEIRGLLPVFESPQKTAPRSEK